MSAGTGIEVRLYRYTLPSSNIDYLPLLPVDTRTRPSCYDSLLLGQYQRHSTRYSSHSQPVQRHTVSRQESMRTMLSEWILLPSRSDQL